MLLDACLETKVQVTANDLMKIDLIVYCIEIEAKITVRRYHIEFVVYVSFVSDISNENESLVLQSLEKWWMEEKSIDFMK